MSRAGISVLLFGIYACATGLILITVPNLLLGLLHLPLVTDVWIRVAGGLVTVIGAYYTAAALGNVRPFFRWSVPVRMGLVATFVIFVLLGLVKPVLLLFGAIELASAIWTAVALRADGA